MRLPWLPLLSPKDGPASSPLHSGWALGPSRSSAFRPDWSPRPGTTPSREVRRPLRLLRATPRSRCKEATGSWQAPRAMKVIVSFLLPPIIKKVAQPEPCHRKTHDSVCCHTNFLSSAQRECQNGECVFTEVKTHSRHVVKKYEVCVAFLSYHTIK